MWSFLNVLGTSAPFSRYFRCHSIFYHGTPFNLTVFNEVARVSGNLAQVIFTVYAEDILHFLFLIDKKHDSYSD